MALSGPERAKVRKYLGWAARFHSTDDRLEQAMSALAGTPDDEAEVRTELASLADIDAQIAATNSITKATQLGSIQMRASYAVATLRSRGRHHVGRIASILGVVVRNDAFSGGGPVAYSGPYGPES